MAAVSKPVMFIGIAGVLLAVVLAQQEEPNVRKPKANKAKNAQSTSKPSAFTQVDYEAHFDKPKAKVRNLFMPLVIAEGSIEIENPTDVPVVEDLDKIPADLASDEAGWIFTGFATVNGENMALLENSTTKQGGFVKKGEPWKATRILKITPQSVVLRDKEGGEKIILRHDPHKAKKTPAPDAGGVKPVDPSGALQGPIGGPGGPPGAPGTIRPGGAPGGVPGGAAPGSTVISGSPTIIRG